MRIWMKRLSATSVVLFALALPATPGAQVPGQISYQGAVTVDSTNFTGNGLFRFALVNGTGTTTLWSNDGTSTAGSQPTFAVTLPVTNGAFSVPLGDASLPNMTPIPTAAFAADDTWLRIWFDDGTHGVQRLMPDRRVTSVGYAVRAASADTLQNIGVTGLWVQRASRADPGGVTHYGTNVIGGLTSNSVSNGIVGATVFGGTEDWDPVPGRLLSFPNIVTGDGGTVSGGELNSAAAYANVAGGQFNSADGKFASVGGGYFNSASTAATVGGGNSNSANGDGATIAGGYNNSADGKDAMVAGGRGNDASGEATFAAGTRARAREPGMFAWADSQNFDFDPVSFRVAGESANTFNVRATGASGVQLVLGINGTTGAPTWSCSAHNGIGWTCTSDRNVKRNLQAVDGKEVLAKVAAMPVFRWQPKDGPGAESQHVGPMAQDFYATFGLGDSDRSIGLLDASGVALAAIQGLKTALDEQATELARLSVETRIQAAVIVDQKARIIALERQSAEIAEIKQQMAQLVAQARASALAASAE